MSNLNKIAILIIPIMYLTISCISTNNSTGILIRKQDEKTSLFAYYDEKGNKILGDYFAAYTDTIRDYGIVADSGFVLIDKKGKHIYKIFTFDNGPDETSEGLYRIVENGKIGYVDSITSKIIIKPIYECAFPFENGKAKVSLKVFQTESSSTKRERTAKSF